MSIKKTLEDFEEKFCEDVDKHPWLTENEANQIKQFITKEIEKALNEVVPEEAFMYKDFSKEKEVRGWNACIEQIKFNISNYIKE